MTVDLHDSQRVNTGSAHVGNSRMPEIVKAKVFDPCPLTGRFEDPFEREYRLTTVQEDMLLMWRPRLVKFLEHL